MSISKTPTKPLRLNLLTFTYTYLGIFAPTTFETIFFDTTLSKADQYKQLIPQIKALIKVEEEDRTANLANVAAVLKSSLNFFWVGVYEFKKEELVLAPFQSPIACSVQTRSEIVIA